MAPMTFQEAESIYTRATKLEFSEQFTFAFHQYIEATQAFLNLARSPTATPDFQAQCRANAQKAIQRAEKIQKASKTPGAQISVVVPPIDPFGADHQTYVLRKSSTVNGVRYPLWNESVPSPSILTTLYSYVSTPDDTLCGLSFPSQRSEWAAKDPTVHVCQFQGHYMEKTFPQFLFFLDPDTRRYRSEYKIQLTDEYVGILRSMNYVVTIRLNSPWHGQISIDDLLPFDEPGRPMGISSGSKAVAWPALIEKAYMKLMGGYDFPGSNSSIDLRVLTGWIPEHVDLQSTSFERERTWERLINGFQKGHCVLCVGTDAKTILKIQGVKLLPSHAYAVVDIRGTNSERWLTLIDSRVPAINSVHAERENGNHSNSRMLNMRWDDICATFEGIYVSWDPGLFWHSADLHEVWKPANANDEAQASVRHLRLLYECRNSQDGDSDSLDMSKDVWVLLTRHFSYTHRAAEYISLTVHAADADDWRDMWVKTGNKNIKGTYTTSPHVLVRTNVGKGFLAPSHQHTSVSAPDTKISGALSILASYDGPFKDVFFTVNVFCGVDVEMRWDVDAGMGDAIGSSGGFSAKHDGTLTTKNAGGNCTHLTYMINPQWHLRIHDEKPSSSGRARALHSSRSLGSLKMADVSGRTGPKSVVVLSVQGPREVPLNVTVVWYSGERVAELTQKEVVTSSGAYTYGQARAAGDMAPGDYTVIVSAFEPQVHLGPFTLKVDSWRQFDLESIPPEGAGMYTRVSKGEWNEHTAVGGPSHGRYHLNPIYEVQLPSRAELSARLHLVSPAPAAALNLSLFPASSSASKVPTLDRKLADSGPFSDALSGVCIPKCMVSAGKYWFVPSTYSAGVKTSFRLVVYCSDAGCVVSRR